MLKLTKVIDKKAVYEDKKECFYIDIPEEVAVQVEPFKTRTISREEAEKIVDEALNEILRKPIYEDTSLLQTVKEKVATRAFPHTISFGSDIYGHAGWSLRIQIDGEIPTAWSLLDNQDGEKRNVGVSGCYIGDGEVLWQSNVKAILEDIKNDPPSFFLIDVEGTNNLKRALAKYIEYDANDISGHELGALVTIDCYGKYKERKELEEKAYEYKRERERQLIKEFLITEIKEPVSIEYKSNGKIIRANGTIEELLENNHYIILYSPMLYPDDNLRIKIEKLFKKASSIAKKEASEKFKTS